MQQNVQLIALAMVELRALRAVAPRAARWDKAKRAKIEPTAR